MKTFSHQFADIRSVQFRVPQLPEPAGTCVLFIIIPRTSNKQILLHFTGMPLCDVHFPLLVGSIHNFCCSIENKSHLFSDRWISFAESYQGHGRTLRTTKLESWGAVQLVQRPSLYPWGLRWSSVVRRSNGMLWSAETGIANLMQSDAVYRRCIYTLPSEKRWVRWVWLEKQFYKHY